MGVLSLAPNFPAQSTYSRRGRRYRLPYKIETTTGTEEYEVRNALMSAVPYHSRYAGDPLATVSDYEISQSSETRDQFLAVVIFDYEGPTQLDTHPDKVALNLPPWQLPPTKHYSGTLRQVPASKAFIVNPKPWAANGTVQLYGSGHQIVEDNGLAVRRPIRNTAGFPPDPLPIEERAHRVITFRKNYAAWDEYLIRNIVARINNKDLGARNGDTLFPVYPKYTLKVLSAEAEEKWEGRFHYWASTLIFEYNPDLWVTELPNVGLVEKVWDQMDNKNPPNQFKHYREIEASEPQPLDEYGRRIRSEIKPGGNNPGQDNILINAYIVPKLVDVEAYFGPLPW
jgi:hypothetical protein